MRLEESSTSKKRKRRSFQHRIYGCIQQFQFENLVHVIFNGQNTSSAKSLTTSTSLAQRPCCWRQFVLPSMYLQGSYPFTEVQSMYSEDTADRAITKQDFHLFESFLGRLRTFQHPLVMGILYVQVVNFERSLLSNKQSRATDREQTSEELEIRLFLPVQ